MNTKKFSLLKILFFGLTAMLLFCSCSNDVDDVMPSQIEDVKKLLKLKLENDTVYINADVITSQPNCNVEYNLMDNGDYLFTYSWPYQSAVVWAQNTEECQFGCPENPVIIFSRHSDNIYDATLNIEMVYVMDNAIQRTNVQGRFIAVIKD